MASGEVQGDPPLKGIRTPPFCNQTLAFDELCGGPVFKTLGADSYCSTHYSRWLLDHATRDDRLRTGIHSFGIGLQNGELVPEMGPGYARLKCWVCGATWTGVIGDQCYWCVKEHQRMLDVQAEYTLTPPDVDLDDIRRPRMLEAWKERLKTAVDAELITKEEAVRAFERELGRT